MCAQLLCPCGSHAQHRQVSDVAVRAHATFATTRPGVCPLPQASATAPLHWPLTTPSRAAVSPHIVSYPTCARLLGAHGHPHQHLAVKTWRIHVAKVSLSNRPLFECLVITKTNPDRCDFKHMPGLLLSSSFCFCFCFYFVLLSLSLSLLRKLEYVIILFQFMLLELLHPRILIIIRMCHIIMRMCHTIICSLLSIMVYWFARLEGIEGKAMP